MDKCSFTEDHFSHKTLEPTMGKNDTIDVQNAAQCRLLMLFRGAQIKEI